MSRRNKLWPYLAIAALVTALLLVLPIPLSRLDVPYTFWGDAIDKLAQIANVKETGWLFHNDRLGYPFGYGRLDFPRFDSLNYLLMGPIVALSGEPGLTMNVYFILGFYLIAFAAYFAFKRMGLDTATALLCSLIYAFLPYHVIRGVGHLTNGAYYLVPLAMLVLVWLAQSRLGVESAEARRRWLFALAVAALVPLQMPYNGVFFAFLCVPAAAIAIARDGRWRMAAIAITLLVATGAAFVVEQIPVSLHAWREGKPNMVAARIPAEAEIYSLRLNQVLLPTTIDRRTLLRKFAVDFDQALNVPVNESHNQYIGLFGVIGFAALLWAVCRSLGNRVPREDEAAVRVAAVLALATLLLAMSSGLCTMIAYLVTAKVRAYNRILPFFAFACVLGGGWVFQTAVGRLRAPWLRMSVIAVIGVLALMDLLVRSPFLQHPADVAAYDLARNYFEGVERRLGNGAAVFQLPVVWYPEHPPINRMTDYEEFKPFLFTKTLKFSYGVSRGRIGYDWNKYVENLALPEKIAELHAMGFAAILVDANAYADAATLNTAIDALKAALAEAPSVSADERWWTFPLEGCCGGGKPVQIKPGKAPTVFTYPADGSPVRFGTGGSGTLYATGEWAEPEIWGRWSLGEHARLRIRLDSLPSHAIALDIDTQVVLGPKVPERKVSVACNGQPVTEATYTVTNARQHLRLDIPATLVGEDGLLDLEFTTLPAVSPRSAGLNQDMRVIGVGLIELSIAGGNHAP
jgi:phosphoglycerol transferase